MPELLAIRTVDFLAGNILLGTVPGAARPRDLHYQKKAQPIRLLVNPAGWYRRVKAEVAISVNGTLGPAIGILIRLRSFSPGCCMRDTAIRSAACTRRRDVYTAFPRLLGRRKTPRNGSRARLRQTFFQHYGMLYVKKMVPLRHRKSRLLGAEIRNVALGGMDGPTDR